jgi:hypothetical protein
VVIKPGKRSTNLVLQTDSLMFLGDKNWYKWDIEDIRTRTDTVGTENATLTKSSAYNAMKEHIMKNN